MTKEILNLKVQRAADEKITIEVTSLDGEEIDYSDCVLDLHIKPNKKEDGVIKLSSRTGEISATGNVITIKIARHKTLNATWRIAEYDIQVTDPAGMVTYPFGGVVELQHNITVTDKTEGA